MAWAVVKGARLDTDTVSMSMNTEMLPGPVKVTMIRELYRVINVMNIPGVYYALELKKQLRNVPIFDSLEQAQVAYPDAVVVSKTEPPPNK